MEAYDRDFQPPLHLPWMGGRYRQVTNNPDIPGYAAKDRISFGNKSAAGRERDRECLRSSYVGLRLLCEQPCTCMLMMSHGTHPLSLPGTYTLRVRAEYISLYIACAAVLLHLLLR
jgi:hypothetical protein